MLICSPNKNTKYNNLLPPSSWESNIEFFLYKVTVYINVFCAFMKYLIGCNLYGGLVITVEDGKLDGMDMEVL